MTEDPTDAELPPAVPVLDVVLDAEGQPIEYESLETILDEDQGRWPLEVTLE